MKSFLLNMFVLLLLVFPAMSHSVEWPEVVAQVHDYAEAQALTGISDGDHVSISENGRGGMFVYREGDCTSRVATDTLGGVYLPVTADPIGANGCLVRQYSGPVSVHWFGAVGDGVNIDTSAFNGAISLGSEIDLDPSKNYLVGKLDIKDDLTINLNGSTLTRDVANNPGNSNQFARNAWIFQIDNTTVDNVVFKNGVIDDKHSDDNTKYRGFLSVVNGGSLTNSRLEGLEFLNSYSGLLVANDAKTQWAAERVVVDNCIFRSLRASDATPPSLLEHGYSLAAFNYAKNCTVKGSKTFYSNNLTIFNQNDGVVKNTGNSIINCVAIETADTAMYLYGDNSLAFGNYVDTPGKDGIKINSLAATTSTAGKIIGNILVGAPGRVKSDGSNMILAVGENHLVSGNTIRAESGDLDGHAISSFSGIIGQGKSIKITESTVSIDSSLSGCDGVTLSTTTLYTGEYTGAIVSKNDISAPGKVLLIGAEDYTECSVSDNVLMPSGTNSTAITMAPGTTHAKPLHSSFTGNKIISQNSSSRALNMSNADRVIFSANSVTGFRQRDFTSAPSNYGAILGVGNMSDKLIDPAFGYAPYAVIPSGVNYGGSVPSLGTWLKGEIARSDSTGLLCTAAGTQGVLSGATGSITVNTDLLTVNETDGIFPGVYIDIVGVSGTKRVFSVSGNVVTLDSDADATVSDAAVSYSSATFSVADPGYL